LQAGNLFVFGINNPVMWIDPLGLFVMPAGGENFRYTNPIVYQALNDLIFAYGALDRFRGNLDLAARYRIMISQMRIDITNLGNTVFNIGNHMTVSAEWWMEPFISRGFNSTQVTLLASSPAMGKGMLAATVESQLLFWGDLDGSIENANKHALWNALGVLYTRDAYFVRLFTDAHEFGSRYNFSDIDPFRHMAIDIQNNRIGLAIGGDSLARGFWARQVTSHQTYIRQRLNHMQSSLWVFS